MSIVFSERTKICDYVNMEHGHSITIFRIDFGFQNHIYRQLSCLSLLLFIKRRSILDYS